MPLLPEPNSADSVGDESQNREHDLQSLVWQNIKINEETLAEVRRLIEEIVNSTDDIPNQITEAADGILDISSGINAIMISLYLLARLTKPLLFSRYRTTRRISSGL